MPGTLLDRTLLIEAARLTLFYGVVYLALISIALIAPLVENGAPLWSVLQVLPGQLPFPATIVIPLALTTAVLATFGRMRDDGELIALRAAGISAGRLPLALLPLVVVLLLVVGLLAHAGMPAAYRSFRTAKSALARQAVATQVAREKPIWKSSELNISALGIVENTLTDLFAWRHDGNKELLVYAPRARWVTDPERASDEQTTLRLELQQTRQLMIERHPAGPPTITTLRFPNLVIDQVSGHDSFEEKAEGKSTAALLTDLRDNARLADRLRGCPPEELPQALLTDYPSRLDAGEIDDWPRFRRRLAGGDHPLGQALSPETRARLEQDDDALRERILAELDQALPTIHRLIDERPDQIGGLLQQWLADESLPDQFRRPINLLLLHHCFPGDFVFHGLDHSISEVSRHYFWHRNDHQAALAAGLGRARRELIGHQMAWHLRLVLSFGVIPFALFACGLGLNLASRNRLLAAALGLGVVLVCLLPGVALVKGMRGKLPVHPGWILWTPQLLLALLGTWLIWRRR